MLLVFSWDNSKSQEKLKIMVLFGAGGGGEHKKISMLFSKVVNGPSPAELKLRDKNVSGYQLGSIT